MSHTPESYLIVACSASEQGREGIYSILRSRVQKHSLVTDAAVLDIPLTLKYGSFDDLIRLIDDLTKYDISCEAILRRMERQLLDTDPSAEPKVVFQRNAMTADQYLQRFSWDESKYSRLRLMRDNLDSLLASVTRIDDEVRIKSSIFSEIKQHHSAASKKDASSFTQRDLSDVLTPEKVVDGDFVETEHLTTAVVVVPRGMDEFWLKNYETLEHNIVPSSSKKFDVVDREGNSLYRVVLFKNSLEPFRATLKTKRLTLRDFKYNPLTFSLRQEERSKLEAEKSKQESFMSRVCLAAFSDVFIAWVHLKVMRVFVESVLRFGVPPNFAAFILKPNPSKEARLRKELEDVFTTGGMFGKSFIEASHGSQQAGDEDEDYYPYVSISLTPFQAFVQK